MDSGEEDSLLFRPEALNAQSQRSFGRVRIFTPWPLKLLFGCAIIFAVLLVCFLFFGNYTRQARAFGRLVPIGGLIEVVSNSNGTIQSISRKGGSVAKGDVLATLLLERKGPSTVSAEASMMRQLSLQKSLLQVNFDAKSTSGARERSAATNALETLRVQKNEVQRQISNIRQQIETQTATLKKLKDLNSKQYVSLFQVQQQEAGLMDLQNQISNLSLRELDLDLQISKQREMIQSSLSAQTEALNDLTIQQSNVAQKLEEISAQRAPTIVAPTSGLIVGSTVKVGKSVSAGEALYTIVPTGSDLEAELLVPSSVIGFINEGRKVKLRYSAFPYQQFGMHYGVISNISKSAMSPAQASNLYGEQILEPVYKVTIALSSQVMRVNGKDENLMPGMQVEADVLLDRRSLVDWILSPAYGLRRRFGEVSP